MLCSAIEHGVIPFPFVLLYGSLKLNNVIPCSITEQSTPSYVLTVHFIIQINMEALRIMSFGRATAVLDTHSQRQLEPVIPDSSSTVQDARGSLDHPSFVKFFKSNLAVLVLTSVLVYIPNQAHIHSVQRKLH